jgi:hypothetical protein
MVIIKKLIVPIMFLVTTSITQSMDEPNGATTDKQRWPLQARFMEEFEKAKQVPELKIILEREAPVGEVLSLDNVQALVSNLPWNAEGNYLEINFTLISETDESEKPALNTLIARFDQAFMNDYRHRFPQDDKSNFDAGMLPLKDYFNKLSQPTIESWSEEKNKDEYEKAWALLRKALKK